MAKKLLLFQSVMIVSGLIFSCTGGDKRQSAWAELDAAESIDCRNWPLREKDLGVVALMPLKGPATKGIIATVKLRDTSTAYYFAPFEGKTNVDPDDFKPISLGRSAAILGMVHMGGKDLVAVVQKGKTRPRLELRSEPDNVVRYELADLPDDVVAGTVHPVGEGFWAALKHHERSSSLLFVSSKGDNKTLKATVFNKLAMTTFPVVLPLAGEPGALVVLYDAVAAGAGKADVFKVAKVLPGGDVQGPKTLAVGGETEEIESFAATVENGQFHLSFVGGDSMVGQGRLQILQFKWDYERPAKIGGQSITLPDVHVSEPVWIAGKDALGVGLLKWVDEESTLATYRWNAGKVAPVKTLGLFKKGSRIIETFRDEDGRPFAIVRSKDKEKWDYQVCNLKKF